MQLKIAPISAFRLARGRKGSSVENSHCGQLSLNLGVNFFAVATRHDKAPCAAVFTNCRSHRPVTIGLCPPESRPKLTGRRCVVASPQETGRRAR